METAKQIIESAKITVVMPVRNRASIVLDTLKSIERQTYLPLKIVLVDNNSTDNTLQVLTEWKQRVERADLQVEITAEEYPSAAAARRKGSELVDTEYVMFFDSDDIMTPDHIRLTMEEFNMHPDADLVGWSVEIVDSQRRLIKKHNFPHKSLFYRNMLNGALSTQRYAMRTRLLLDVGNWNPKLRGWDDLELGTRIALHNPIFSVRQGAPTVCIIRHPDSITGSHFSHDPAKWHESLSAISAYLTTKRQKRTLRLQRAVLAGEYAHEGRTDLCDNQLLEAIQGEKSYFYRLLYRTACRWVASGLPGVSIVMRPFF